MLARPRRRLAPLVAAALTPVAAHVATAVVPAGVPGDADFAADLFTRVAADPAKNVFVSPYSLRAALAMVQTGAAGDTARQMSAALRLPPGGADATGAAFASATAAVTAASGDGCQVDVANAVWAAAGTPFRPPFMDRLKADFAASARTVDFAAHPDAARQQINGWAEEKTHGKIHDLLPPDSVRSDTRLVLTNAVYFKGTWEEPFVPHRTSNWTFHLDAHRDASVRMMERGTDRMRVYQSDALDAVELPYRGGGASMLVVVPRAIDGLPPVVRGLTGDVMRQWFDGLRPTQTLLMLPRFAATGSYDLVPTLAAMGMPDAFGRKADFSGMLDPSAGPPLCIGGVFHKTFVAVDEQGTEAAAASGITMRMTAMAPPRDRIVVVADRPFLYLIRERTTGAVLFIGRCADPRT
jgi:serpin B